MFIELPKTSKNKLSLYLSRKIMVLRLYRGGYMVVCLWLERGGRARLWVNGRRLK